MPKIISKKLETGHSVFYSADAMAKAKDAVSESECFVAELEGFFHDDFELIVRPFETYVEMMALWSLAFALKEKSEGTDAQYLSEARKFFANEFDIAVISDRNTPPTKAPNVVH